MKTPVRHVLIAVLLAGAAALPGHGTQAQGTAAPAAPAGTAVVLEINGAIGPATARYVVRGLEAARRDGARVVVLEMDTPGGLDSSMRDIIRAIVPSPIRVITYVAPRGARPASAGTYILYASHIAAMAPATNLGAATPVSIGGEPEPAPAPSTLPSSRPEQPPQSGSAPACGPAGERP